jgi:short-subunit dehydrogenase
MSELIKYAVVTGASSGIGWHISKELAVKGYSIIAVSNQSSALSKLKAELENDYQIEVLTIDCDLSKRNAAQVIFDFCRNGNLIVEVLVNNAGILAYGEAINIKKKKTKNILQLHMNTPVMLCRLFGKLMAKNHKGYILNVSSISASMPYPTISLYGPTKAFLRQFTKALRIELKSAKVNVTCLIPGPTATNLYDDNKINFPLPEVFGIVKKPEEVAKAGVTALFNNKAEKIPGIINKIIMIIVPIIPIFIIGFIYRKNLKLK